MPRVNRIDGGKFRNIVMGVKKALTDPDVEDIRIQDGADDECTTDLMRAQAGALLRRLESRSFSSAR